MDKSMNLIDGLNNLFYEEPAHLNFIDGHKVNPYGDDIFQGPLWIRPKSLRLDQIPDYIQVVGHTHMKTLYPDKNVVFIDTLSSGEYLILEDNVQIVGDIDLGIYKYH